MEEEAPVEEAANETVEEEAPVEEAANETVEEEAPVEEAANETVEEATTEVTFTEGPANGININYDINAKIRILPKA